MFYNVPIYVSIWLDSNGVCFTVEGADEDQEFESEVYPLQELINQEVESYIQHDIATDTCQVPERYHPEIRNLIKSLKEAYESAIEYADKFSIEI